MPRKSAKPQINFVIPTPLLAKLEEKSRQTGRSQQDLLSHGLHHILGIEYIPPEPWADLRDRIEKLERILKRRIEQVVLPAVFKRSECYDSKNNPICPICGSSELKQKGIQAARYVTRECYDCGAVSIYDSKEKELEQLKREKEGGKGFGK